MTATSRFRYWPGWAAVLSAGVGLAMLLTVGACRRGMPVIDPSPGPTEAWGTISGTVRGPDGISSIENRLVEVINLETGERHKVATNNAGGFTVKVKPGKYRVQVALLSGETVIKQPGVMNVNRSDVDAHADFVIGQVRLSRPGSPVYQPDPGLGSPIA